MSFGLSANAGKKLLQLPGSDRPDVSCSQYRKANRAFVSYAKSASFSKEARAANCGDLSTSCQQLFCVLPSELSSIRKACDVPPQLSLSAYLETSSMPSGLDRHFCDALPSALSSLRKVFSGRPPSIHVSYAMFWQRVRSPLK